MLRKKCCIRHRTKCSYSGRMRKKKRAFQVFIIYQKRLRKAAAVDPVPPKAAGVYLLHVGSLQCGADMKRWFDLDIQPRQEEVEAGCRGLHHPSGHIHQIPRMRTCARTHISLQPFSFPALLNILRVCFTAESTNAAFPV